MVADLDQREVKAQCGGSDGSGGGVGTTRIKLIPSAKSSRGSGPFDTRDI